MLGSDGLSLLDDMAPEMTRVSYLIKVKIVRYQGLRRRATTLVEMAKKVRVVPVYEEQPPLSFYSSDGQYMLQTKQIIKKGVFKDRAGTLTMEAPQPRSLHLSVPGSTDAAPTSTMATINLRFDPANRKSRPPRLVSLYRRLKAVTFYGCTPMKDFPARGTALVTNSATNMFVNTFYLPAYFIESVQWQERREVPEFRRSLIPLPELDGQGPKLTSGCASTPFYTASLVVPITIPTARALVPSFHSCFVSRVYILDLSLIYNTSTPYVSDSTLSLKVPIQVSSAQNTTDRPPASVSEDNVISGGEFGLLAPRINGPHYGMETVENGQSEQSLSIVSTDYEGEDDELPRYISLSSRPVF